MASLTYSRFDLKIKDFVLFLQILELFISFSLWNLSLVLMEWRMSWFIQPGCWHFLTRFFLSGACLSSKERNVSLNNCTAAEGSSYEFIFDQDCWAKSLDKRYMILSYLVNEKLVNNMSTIPWLLGKHYFVRFKKTGHSNKIRDPFSMNRYLILNSKYNF